MHSAHAREFTPGPSPGSERRRRTYTSGVVAGKGQSIDTMASAATHFWTDEETRFMLTQVQELNILKFMDGRKTRNADLG